MLPLISDEKVPGYDYKESQPLTPDKKVTLQANTKSDIHIYVHITISNTAITLKLKPNTTKNYNYEWTSLTCTVFNLSQTA